MRKRRRLAVVLVALLASAGVLVSPAIFGQAFGLTITVSDDAMLPRFEVASVKPGDNGQSRFAFPRGRFSQANVSLTPALVDAFEMHTYQLAQSVPDLLDRPFTIEAEAAQADASLHERALMIRALLIDRFKLRYHVVHTVMDGYVLTVARRDGSLGPSMRRSALDCGATGCPAAGNRPAASRANSRLAVHGLAGTART